jgi:hypothetical protein
MRRLIAGIAAAALVYVPLALYVDSQVSAATPWVVLIAGITAAVLAVTMVASTRGWSLRAVGLCLYLVGLAVLLIGGYVGYRWGIGRDTGEVLNDVILSVWIVGCPLALTGAALYWAGKDRPDGGT